MISSNSEAQQVIIPTTRTRRTHVEITPEENEGFFFQIFFFESFKSIVKKAPSDEDADMDPSLVLAEENAITRFLFCVFFLIFIK